MPTLLKATPGKASHRRRAMFAFCMPRAWRDRHRGRHTGCKHSCRRGPRPLACPSHATDRRRSIAREAQPSNDCPCCPLPTPPCPHQPGGRPAPLQAVHALHYRTMAEARRRCQLPQHPAAASGVGATSVLQPACTAVAPGAARRRPTSPIPGGADALLLPAVAAGVPAAHGSHGLLVLLHGREGEAAPQQAAVKARAACIGLCTRQLQPPRCICFLIAV